MGRLYQRSPGGPWYAYFRDADGKKRWRSLNTRDKAVAKERLRSAELASTPASSRGKLQTLSEALHYMITATLHDKAAGTVRMYEEKGRRLVMSFGDPDIRSISRDNISAYIQRRLDKSDTPAAKEHGRASPHTVQKELITLRKALTEAHQRGVLVVMPSFPRFSAKYKPRERWLTPAQFEDLVKELPKERELWCALAALAGGNLSEVEGVVWEDVDLEKSWLRIRGTKRETRDRRVPIAPALHARLVKVPVSARAGRVVGPWKNVRHELARACARAKVPRVSPNDLRRTFASWLAQQGVPLLTIANLMGHSSTRMVERVYGKLSAANLESAIATLPGAPAIPVVAQLEAPKPDMGETSDGYHTFNELYAHRISLFIALCTEVDARTSTGYVWRSKLHSDGSSIDGWFVMGIGRAPGEQITYHLPISRWSETDWLGAESERAPAFDGHTSADVLERLKRFAR